MIRFICFLLGKPYESCKSCETLKEQLSFERSEKQQLTNTLLNILQPKAIEAAPIELNSIQQSSALFSRRRAALEAKDREEAKILRNSTSLGKPDFVNNDNESSTNQLEEELGIEKEV